MTLPEKILAVSAGIQAIATIVLVVITYLQMKKATASVESMERSTKAGFLPIIVLGFVTHSSDDKHINIYLSNCGKGIAIKPKVIFPGQADITINSLNVGEQDNVTLEYNIEFILTKTADSDRKILVEYHDVFGRKIMTQAVLRECQNFGPDANGRGISWDTWAPIIP